MFKAIGRTKESSEKYMQPKKVINVISIPLAKWTEIIL